MKRQLGQLLLLLRVLDQPLCDFLGRSCVRPRKTWHSKARGWDSLLTLGQVRFL